MRSEKKAMGGRKLKVLLCAGDRNLLRHLAKFLGVVGFEVEQAADVRLAEAASAAARPDFLILDDMIAAGDQAALAIAMRIRRAPVPDSGWPG